MTERQDYYRSSPEPNKNKLGTESLKTKAMGMFDKENDKKYLWIVSIIVLATNVGHRDLSNTSEMKSCLLYHYGLRDKDTVQFFTERIKQFIEENSLFFRTEHKIIDILCVDKETKIEILAEDLKTDLEEFWKISTHSK